MALGTNHHTVADVAVSVPEIWGQAINDYLKYDLVLANFFTDRSDELVGGGDTVHTVNILALSTNAKSNGSQVTLSSPTQTSQDLVVSTWQESSFLIEDREMAHLKKSLSIQEQLAKSAAYEVAQDLDTAIAQLFSGFSQVIGTSTANVADSDLVQALATLDAAGVDLYSGDTAWFLHPNTFYRQIGGIDKMTLWQNTASEMPRTKQPTRMLYGIPVLVSSALINVSGSDGRYNAIAHKDAIHWARLSLAPSAEKAFVGDSGVRVQQSYIQEYLGSLVTCDLCYGVIENFDTKAVQILSHATAA